MFVCFLLRSFDWILKALASQWRLVFDNRNSDVNVEGELDTYYALVPNNPDKR